MRWLALPIGALAVVAMAIVFALLRRLLCREACRDAGDMAQLGEE
jgi:hypothetical protein